MISLYDIDSLVDEFSDLPVGNVLVEFNIVRNSEWYTMIREHDFNHKIESIIKRNVDVTGEIIVCDSYDNTFCNFFIMVKDIDGNIIFNNDFDGYELFLED